MSAYRMSAAIAEMQKNPKAAMQKYANDTEVTSFIMAFMRLMGDHMEDLGAAEERQHKEHEERRKAEQAKPRQADPEQVQRWMSDPTIRVSSHLTNLHRASRIWQPWQQCSLLLMV